MARSWKLDGSRGCPIAPRHPRVVVGKTNPDTVAAVVALRRVWPTAAEITDLIDKPLSTLSAVLNRGAAKRPRLHA
jgi:hypothetical protein